QVPPVHVCVDLGRGHIRMSKHLLYRYEVGAPFQEMRREGMTQCMRAHLPCDAGALHVPPQDLPHAHPREWPTSRVQKYAALPPALLQPWPHFAKIERECTHRTSSDGNDPLLAPLSEDQRVLLLQRQMPDRKI